MDYTEKLIAVAQGKLSATSTVEEIMQDISAKIASAINPVNGLTVPFTIAVLDNYSDMLKKQFPIESKFSKPINMAMEHTEISYPQKLS